MNRHSLGSAVTDVSVRCSSSGTHVPIIYSGIFSPGREFFLSTQVVALGPNLEQQTVDTQSLQGSQRPKRRFQADMEFFKGRKAEIVEKYEGRYIAIVDTEIVDFDTSFANLAQRVYSQFGTKPIYMPFVTREQRVFRIPSPKITRSPGL